MIGVTTDADLEELPEPELEYAVEERPDGTQIITIFPPGDENLSTEWITYPEAWAGELEGCR